MTFKQVFILGFVFFAAGIACLAAVWHGTAAFGASLPLSGSSVTVSGSANGGWALLGFFATLFGAILLVVAFVLALLPARAAKPDRLSKAQVTD